MPFYTFEDKNTGETQILEMRMSELDPFKESNPNLQQILTTLHIDDPIRLGITKPPSDFQKYVLGRIKHSVPESSVEKRWNIVKEI